MSPVASLPSGATLAARACARAPRIAPRSSPARIAFAVALSACAGILAGPARALEESTGPLGINVYDAEGDPFEVDGFPYTGFGIKVGQVENFRPGDPTPGPFSPSPDSPAFTQTNVDPFTVFETALGGTSLSVKPDRAIDSHPERVAGVMISTHSLFKGAAPDALLHAFAFTNSDGANRSAGEIANGSGGVNGPSDPQVHIYAARSTQSIVQGNSPGNRTIPVNLSFGLQASSGFSFTHFLDWSASTHNALYVTTAGNVGQAGLTVPANQYNGLTVAATCNGAVVAGSCISTPGTPYNRISPLSLAPVDATGRRLVDLVAPGESITTPTIDEGFATSSGTSFAAPHATGTVALLQQFAQNSIGLGPPGFAAGAYQHEVTKAVLMNSADKRQDTGNGLLLGMEKTVQRSNGQDWIEQRGSEPGRDAIPLDSELGTGALNARRAFQRFILGEHDPGTVPNIGWDHQNTLAPGNTLVYSFEQPLVGGSFVALTLAWDRIVANTGTWGEPDMFDAEIFHDVGVVDVSGATIGADDLTFTTLRPRQQGAFHRPERKRQLRRWPGGHAGTGRTEEPGLVLDAVRGDRPERCGRRLEQHAVFGGTHLRPGPEHRLVLDLGVPPRSARGGNRPVLRARLVDGGGAGTRHQHLASARVRCSRGAGAGSGRRLLRHPPRLAQESVSKLAAPPQESVSKLHARMPPLGPRQLM
jgi:hypothetical protein